MHKETDPQKALEQAVEAIRSAQPDAATTNAAASRVWQRLSGELSGAATIDSGRPIGGCADIQELLPAYRAGKLSQAREWLVQDHLRECVNCRNAAQGSRGGVVLPWREPMKAEKRTLPMTQRFVWAAAVFVTLATGTWLLRDSFLPAPNGERARLEWADGPVYIVNAGLQRPLGPQDVIKERDWVRTPSGSHAMLKLRDGSQVEINERSELSVAVNRNDTTINLERGAVLVQAAKRRSGHLLVASNDATVSVTGTIFSVDRGVKGTRVAVVEGEVLVDQRNRTDTLHAGDQIATNRMIEPVAIENEIAWSKNRDQHLKLLNELSEISKRLKTIQLPGMRYNSPLIDALPANTVVYISLPNLGDTLAQAENIVESRIAQNAELRAWWEKNGAQAGPGLKDVVELFRGASNYIGDEVVLALIQEPGQQAQFAAVAEVRRPGLQEFIDSSLTKLSVNERPKMLVNDKIAVLSGEARTLNAFATPGLGGQPFGQKIRETFQDGANIMFCADMSVAGSKVDTPLSKKLGTDDVRYLVLAERDFSGHSETRATLNFAGTRHGLASWLGTPGPMGSLDFVSPNATVSASFVMKTPALLVDDLFALAESSNPQFRENLQKTEAEIGVSLREDLAASLGNDVTVAVDGPVLPVPAWKVVAEVRDPARLQQAIERLVAAGNKAAAEQKLPQVKIETTQVNNRAVYSLTVPEKNFSVQYAYTDGYVVITPDADGMNRAFRTRDGGWNLARSGRFQSLLPADGHTNFSAVVYHNLHDVAAALKDTVDASGAKLTPDQQALVNRLTGDVKPGLIYAYGLDDRIQVASTTSFLGLTLDSLLQAGGLAQMVNRDTLMQMAAANQAGPGSKGPIRFHFGPARNNR
jgi:ferric-dicitrate binding protein FerR (iron transport regulator)